MSDPTPTTSPSVYLLKNDEKDELPQLATLHTQKAEQPTLPALQDLMGLPVEEMPLAEHHKVETPEQNTVSTIQAKQGQHLPWRL